GWNFTGYTRLGFPFPYVGHNGHLGWVSTDNSADQADAYVIRFDDPSRPLAYRYGGGWRSAVEWTDTIRVRTERGVEERVVRLRKTHHGPIVGQRGGRPVALRLAKLEADGWLGEWYAMTRARSVADLKAAMQPLNMLFGNVMSADRDGNMFYLYNAAVPRRDPRFDWSTVVDGSDPATEWRGYHTLAELPQLENPATGWMHNCNSSPFMLTSSGNPEPERFPAYMVTEGDNPRARVSREILQGTSTWTFDDWSRAAFDTRVVTADSLLPPLLEAVARARTTASDSASRRVREAADSLRRWDHRASTSSVATTIYSRWRERIQAERERGTLAAEGATMLSAVLDDLVRQFGTWRVPWGEVTRHQRPDERAAEPFADARPSLPLAGVNGADGAVFTYYARPESGQRRRYGVAGASYVSVVELAPRVRGRSVHVYGASGDPASPHYFDQAALYARGELKPAWLYREAVLANAVRSYRPGR
ncbi:MAG: penicillin acylase family protein, partial [Gemmatimonadaceae bacterium]